MKLPFFSSKAGPKSTGFLATIGPLTDAQFKKLVRMGLITLDTPVHREAGRPTQWVRASDEAALSPYFSGGKSIRESVSGLFKAGIDRLYPSGRSPDLRIPEQLFETVTDYLDKGTGDVVLTLGKTHGCPVVIVLFRERDGEPAVVAEIEVDTEGWGDQALAGWPETNSGRAPFWKVEVGH